MEEKYEQNKSVKYISMDNQLYKKANYVLLDEDLFKKKMWVDFWGRVLIAVSIIICTVIFSIVFVKYGRRFITDIVGLILNGRK